MTPTFNSPRPHRCLVAAAALLAATPVIAHHSFAMFDGTKKIPLTGTVAKLEWANPHVWLQLRVQDPSGGATTEWSIECPAVNGLSRAGWTSTSVKPGDKVTAYVHPLRSGSYGGSLADLVLADGTHLGQTQIQRARDQSGQ